MKSAHSTTFFPRHGGGGDVGSSGCELNDGRWSLSATTNLVLALIWG